MKEKIIILFLVIIILILGLSLYKEYFSLGQKNSGQKIVKKDEIIPVKTIKVRKNIILDYIKAVGTIHPDQKALISSKVPGKIEKIYVNVGDYVKKGDVLVKLEQTDFILAIEQAKAAVNLAKANLSKILAGTRKEQIEQAKAGVLSAKAALKNAEIEFNRIKKLFKDKVVPKSAYDGAKTRYDIAKAAYKRANEAWRLAKKGATKEDIDIIKARVQQAEVGLKTAKTQFENTIIKSPIEGFITAKLMSEGERCQTMPPSMILQIMNIKKVKVECSICEREINRIFINMPVKVKVEAYPDEEFNGRVSIITPMVEPVTRTFRVKAEVDNKEFKLKPGMFATLKFIIKKREVITVPKDALIKSEISGLAHVFVVKSNRAFLHTIKYCRGLFDYVEVKKGLNLNDEVVILGLGRLYNGAKVMVKKEGDIK